MFSLGSLQAYVIAALTAAVGAVVAIVPSWAPFEKLIVGAVTAAVVLAFLIANAIHAHGAALTKALTLVQGAAVALITAIAGLVVALVPSFGPFEEAVIGALTAALALGFFIANAIHAHGSVARGGVVAGSGVVSGSGGPRVR